MKRSLSSISSSEPNTEPKMEVGTLGLRTLNNYRERDSVGVLEQENCWEFPSYLSELLEYTFQNTQMRGKQFRTGFISNFSRRTEGNTKYINSLFFLYMKLVNYCQVWNESIKILTHNLSASKEIQTMEQTFKTSHKVILRPISLLWKKIERKELNFGIFVSLRDDLWERPSKSMTIPTIQRHKFN